MVTLMLGDLPVLIPTDVFMTRLREALPGLMTPQGEALGADFAVKERAMRLAAQGGIRLMLGVAGLYMERTGSPLPRPALPKRADPVEYAAGYLLTLIATVLESRPWQLEYTETVEGITVTGLAAPDPVGIAGPVELEAAAGA